MKLGYRRKLMLFRVGENSVKATVFCLVAFMVVKAGAFSADVATTYYDVIIEQKVKDRIEEEKEKMEGRLARCELFCKQ